MLNLYLGLWEIVLGKRDNLGFVTIMIFFFLNLKSTNDSVLDSRLVLVVCATFCEL